MQAVEYLQQARRAEPPLAEGLGERREQSFGAPPKGLVLAEHRQPEEVLGGDGVARGDRPVVGGLVPQEELLRVGSGHPVATAHRVEEELVLRPLQAAGLLEPATGAGRFVEIEEPANQECVVLEVGARAGPAGDGAPHQPLLPVDRALEEKVRCLRRDLGIARLPHREGAPREGADGQAVPGGEHLVVAKGRRPVGPGREELGVSHREPRALGLVDRSARQVQDAPPLEVAAGPNPVDLRDPARFLGAEHPLELGRGPGEEPPLLALAAGRGAVGIGRRVEAALRRPHLPREIVQGLSRHCTETLLAGDLPPLEVGFDELRVVVEHLLEVRHQPTRVGGVAMEPAADLVVDAAIGHRVEGPAHLLGGLRIIAPARVAQEEADETRLGELRRSVPAAPALVVGALELAGGPGDELRSR